MNDVQIENATLRQIISDCASAVGYTVDPLDSLEIMKALPAMIQLKTGVADSFLMSIPITSIKTLQP